MLYEVEVRFSSVQFHDHRGDSEWTSNQSSHRLLLVDADQWRCRTKKSESCSGVKRCQALPAKQPPSLQQEIVAKSASYCCEGSFCALRCNKAAEANKGSLAALGSGAENVITESCLATLACVTWKFDFVWLSALSVYSSWRFPQPWLSISSAEFSSLFPAKIGCIRVPQDGKEYLLESMWNRADPPSLLILSVAAPLRPLDSRVLLTDGSEPRWQMRSLPLALVYDVIGREPEPGWCTKLLVEV